MFKVYFDDIEVGNTEEFGSKTVTKDEIIAFAKDYDPQPFHLNEDLAKMTPLGGLCASGWHTCAMTMRMIVDNMMARGFAGLGSPGLDELNWKKPVRPGDTLHVKSVTEDKVSSKSRPNLGICKIHTYVYNQHDEEVMDMVATVMVARRAG